jgi:hypothetical protein
MGREVQMPWSGIGPDVARSVLNSGIATRTRHVDRSPLHKDFYVALIRPQWSSKIRSPTQIASETVDKYVTNPHAEEQRNTPQEGG